MPIVRHGGHAFTFWSCVRVWVDVDRSPDLIGSDLGRLAGFRRRNQIVDFLQIAVRCGRFNMLGLMLLARSSHQCRGQAQQPECCACLLPIPH
jgi:hypothetical protein